MLVRLSAEHSLLWALTKNNAFADIIFSLNHINWLSLRPNEKVIIIRLSSANGGLPVCR